jgi:hypothetical protein
MKNREPPPTNTPLSETETTSAKGNGSAPFAGEAGNGLGKRLSSTDAFADLDAIKFDVADMLAAYSERFDHIRMGRPGKQTVFRIHQTYQQSGAVYKDESTGDTYFVMPSMRKALLDYIKPVLLVFGMTKQKAPFVWDLSVPNETGGLGSGWAETSRAAAERAKYEWVSIVSDRSMGGYRVFVSKEDIPEPAWPNMTWSEILSAAFHGRILDAPDHPIAKDLLSRKRVL